MEGIEFVSEECNKKIWSEICESSPSDHIIMNHKEDMAICSLWQKYVSNDDVTKVVSPPSDIFFAGTVPILDCIITIDETGYLPTNNAEDNILSVRVVILENYKERILQANEGNVVVGYLIKSMHKGSIIWDIEVNKGNDTIFTGYPASHNLSYQFKENYKKNCSQILFSKQMFEWMTTWYGIQIALLHPLVKNVFQHPESERIYVPGNSNRKNKRKTKYVRKHVIKSDDIDKALHSRGYDRKTLVWYVIGHWRKYEDGKKVFVKPYWKGPLRELKQNMDEGRERIIEPDNVDE